MKKRNKIHTVRMMPSLPLGKHGILSFFITILNIVSSPAMFLWIPQRWIAHRHYFFRSLFFVTFLVFHFSFFVMFRFFLFVFPFCSFDFFSFFVFVFHFFFPVFGFCVLFCSVLLFFCFVSVLVRACSRCPVHFRPLSI